ncbi:MAG: PfkB family carbohydrate kinase [Bacteroidetes bacterium]|nr:PfkB family carbohydrate kinase [Bacteroidota bacterium]MCY4205954.1 PfkB family carbohydrate kinase [Bacteroidota bacterium]
MSILVVGTIALDTIETPWEKADQVLGGSATYISLAARPLVNPVGVTAVIGHDFPEEYTKLLQSNDLDLSGVQHIRDQDTFAWGGSYRENLNTRDTIFTHLNVLAGFRPVVPDKYVDSNVLCLGNLDPKIQSDALNQVSEKIFVACDTMNYWIQNTQVELKEIFQRIDCLVINDEEAHQITNEYNLFTAARRVLELGPDILIIKKGEHGAMLFVEEQIFVVPGFPLEYVQDPTGAGDAFLGAFAGSLAQQSYIGLDALKRGIIYGCTVASFCVEAMGPHKLNQLPITDIEERVRSFQGITQWGALHEQTGV